MGSMWWLWLIAGYLGGSISFALLIGLARGVDIRRIGSGNVGATNLGRVLGRRWGVVCFVLDMLKGLAPVLASGAVMGWLGGADALTTSDAWRWLAVAASAVVGHIYPVWLGFKGGKGAATGFGAMLGLWPVLTLPAIAAAVVWLIILAIFRYVGLATIIATVTLLIWVLVSALLGISAASAGQVTPFIIVTGAMALLVVWRHRANLARLAAGTEPKVGKARP